MPWLGAHLSVAGGYVKAIDAAVALGMDTVQLFTHSPSQWSVKATTLAATSQSGRRSAWQPKSVTVEEADRFRLALQQSGLRRPCAHNSYLINLGSEDAALWEKSIEAMIGEVVRADALGLAGLVFHPGSCGTATEDAALARVIAGLQIVLAETPDATVQLWVEATAGQGRSLGADFAHLGTIVQELNQPQRVGVCIDTCHIFAAGYGLQTPDEYADTMHQLDKAVGLSHVKAFHLNDSKKPRGSRVDRHEHIGAGHLGLEPFRHVLNDRRWADLPMYLETPKGDRDGEDLDTINLRTLRSLMTPSPTSRSASRSSSPDSPASSASSVTARKSRAAATTKSAAAIKSTRNATPPVTKQPRSTKQPTSTARPPAASNKKTSTRKATAAKAAAKRTTARRSAGQPRST
jgi:deoxyribonuclease IV